MLWGGLEKDRPLPDFELNRTLKMEAVIRQIKHGRAYQADSVYFKVLTCQPAAETVPQREAIDHA
ncbi:hypothetical protein MJO57_19295 [Endozoicomonas sp. SCSIO W0465]|nr:hypothetical protein [Endozoicomonas sp. SCSIO W0465]USE34293.1 hypothetical protein MJO57_19295 [Endozoicomonas sp. SCSIO W0465]